MPVTEESRHRLHQKLDRTIGEEDATTLMEHLPPTGWIDIATKQDVEHLDHRFDLVDQRFAVIDDQFKGVNDQFKGVNDQFKGINDQFKAIDHRLDRMEEWMRQQLWRVLTFQVAFAGLLLAAVRVGL